MNMIADLATPSLVYLVFLFYLVFYRSSSELTEGKPWYPKSDHRYYEWSEEPYKWFNMLARALTGSGIVFCAVGLFKVTMTYQYGQPLQYHLGEVFKWSLVAGVLDIIYCVVYNIWLEGNRPGEIVLDDYWEVQSRIPNPAVEAGRAFRRQKRRLSRAQRKAEMLLKSLHGTRGNKKASNPRYGHRY